jgi:DNA sulfur modification protein DndD
MSLSIRLAGWKAQGLRCPDHEVKFETSPGRVHAISLLQMPNGTGKTTTLKLLRAALSGNALGSRWSPEAIRDMRKSTNTATGLFQVAILHNSQRVTFTLKFNFEEPSVEYFTTIPTGNRKGFEPPRELTRFLNESFVDFFVFDGELADSLLDREKTNAQQVIDDLFQLKLFDRMALWVDKYWKDESAKKAKNGGSNSQTSKGLNKWKGWIDRYEARLQALQVQQEKLLADKKRLKTRQTKLRNENDTAIRAKKDYEGRLTAAQTELDAAENEVKNQADRLLQSFRSPHALSPIFAREMIAFKDSLDRVKLPESAAREFFEDLAKEDFCVCGRILDDQTRLAVRERATLYLGSDDVSLLNQMKGEVTAQIGELHDQPAETLKSEIRDLQKAIKKAARLRSTRDAIKSEAVNEDPELERKEQEITKLQEELAKNSVQLERFEENKVGIEIEDTWGITVVEQELERAKKNFAAIADTLKLKLRAEILQEIVRNAHVQSRERISIALCEDANKRIEHLMPNNAIRIERVDRSLRLDGKSGGSAGETLSVAYAFLSTLFHRTEYQLPFVVDSPAGPLDHPKRSAVASLIPELAGQFVAFVISTERDGFQDKLDQTAKSPIQYLTLFRKGDSAMESAAQATGRAESTLDGILVSGKSFFESFQIEKEEGNAVSP